MSYDIDVIISRKIHSDNYTSNISKMYYVAWDEIKDNLPFDTVFEDWKEAIQEEQIWSMPVLKAMIEELKNNSEKYKKMNPSNGWGNYEGAVKFLEDAYKAMLISEDARIVLSY